MQPVDQIDLNDVQKARENINVRKDVILHYICEFMSISNTPSTQAHKGLVMEVSVIFRHIIMSSSTTY